jgi:hypothetical protein
MDKTQQDRIDYVAPKAVDLGHVDALYGGLSCTFGSAATDTCAEGYQAGNTCTIGSAFGT